MIGRTRSSAPGADVPPAARLLVIDGRVSCPRAGRVDVLACFACPWARGLSTEHEERVLCAWTASPEARGPEDDG